MKLTNEEIAKVFAMHFGQEIVYTSDRIKQGQPHRDWGISFENPRDYTCAHLRKYNIRFGKGVFDIGSRKLLLTPLPKISDEHAIEVSKMLRTNSWDNKYQISIYEKYVNDNHEEPIQYAISHVINAIRFQHDVYQYLTLEGYAVPLFFGIGHWANGKTAIELGIAIDKTITK